MTPDKVLVSPTNFLFVLCLLVIQYTCVSVQLARQITEVFNTMCTFIRAQSLNLSLGPLVLPDVNF